MYRSILLIETVKERWTMKRTYSKRFYLYIIFVLVVLIMSWEQSQNQAALASAVIPEESIRLRILANSDQAADQWIKRKVRDAITEQINAWVQESDTIEDARLLIASRMDEIEQNVSSVLAEHGYSYGFQVELGQVPFPTKMYGNRVYPAGEYEALRVTLGEGKGQNWWCVLFPPLCFVDLASGEAVAAETDEAGAEAAEDQASADSVNEKEMKDQVSIASVSDTQEPEVRFFLWDLIQNIGDWFKGLFA